MTYADALLAASQRAAREDRPVFVVVLLKDGQVLDHGIGDQRSIMAAGLGINLNGLRVEARVEPDGTVEELWRSV